MTHFVLNTGWTAFVTPLLDRVFVIYFVFNTGRTGFKTHFSWYIFSFSWHIWYKNSAYFSLTQLNPYLNFLVSRKWTLPRDTLQVRKSGKIRSSVTHFEVNKGQTGFVAPTLDRVSWYILCLTQVKLVLWHIFRDTFSHFRDIYDTKILPILA